MTTDFVRERLSSAKLRKGLFAFSEDEVPSEPLALLALEPEDLSERLGLGFDDSFDGLDSLKLCLLRLPSQRKVALIRHLGSPGTLVAVRPVDVENPDALAEVQTALGLDWSDVSWSRIGDTSADRKDVKAGRHATTKQEFVGRVAAATGLSKRDAAKAVDAILDSITEALKRGDSVRLPGFGTFSTQSRAARAAVDPKKPDQRVLISAATVPKFSAGSGLKASVGSRSRS